MSEAAQKPGWAERQAMFDAARAAAREKLTPQNQAAGTLTVNDTVELKLAATIPRELPRNFAIKSHDAEIVPFKPHQLSDRAIEDNGWQLWNNDIANGVVKTAFVKAKKTEIPSHPVAENDDQFPDSDLALPSFVTEAKAASPPVKINPVHDLQSRIAGTYQKNPGAFIDGVYAADAALGRLYQSSLNFAAQIPRDIATTGAISTASVVGAAALTMAIPHASPAPTAPHYTFAVLSAHNDDIMPQVVIETPQGVVAPPPAALEAPVIDSKTSNTPATDISSEYKLAARIAIAATANSHLFPIMAHTAQITHTSVSRVIAMAAIESGGNTHATNKESSSIGLLQILDRTFLQMVAQYHDDLKDSLRQDTPHLVPVLDIIASSVAEAQKHTKAGLDYLPKAEYLYHKAWARLSAENRKSSSGNLIKDIKRLRQIPAVTLMYGFTQIERETNSLPQTVITRLGGHDAAARCIQFLGRPHTVTLATAPANARARSVLPLPIFTRNHIKTNTRVKDLINDIGKPYIGRIEAIDTEMMESTKLRPYAVRSNDVMAFNTITRGPTKG